MAILVTLRLEPDFLEHFLGVGHDGTREVGIRAGENRVQRLDQDNLAAERGIDGAEFHADVTAADDEQVFGNVLDFQRLGGSHHARIAEVKRLGHRGHGTDRQNRLLIFDELLAALGLDAQFVRAFKITAPGDDLHAAHFGERRHAAAQLGEDGFFPRRAVSPHPPSVRRT